MTLDEQWNFMLERPTPTTPLEINRAPFKDVPPEWGSCDTIFINLGHFCRWRVRWKPEPKTVPAWPPVKPYWVRAIDCVTTRTVEVYDEGHIFVSGCSHKLPYCAEHMEWTTDFKTWHPFTKEV